MDKPKSWGARFRKPLLVCFATLSIIAAGFILYFQSTGVLSSSREYSALFAEAKALGIPTTQNELEDQERRAGKGPNAYATVKQSLASINRVIGAGYIYSEKAGKANPTFTWNPKTKMVFDKCRPAIQSMQNLPADSCFMIEGNREQRFNVSVIHDREVNCFKAFATSLAMQGNFKEADSLFLVAAKLISWQGSEHTILKAMALRNQLTLVDEISAFIRENPDAPELKSTLRKVCDIALEPPYDFRQDYWRNLNAIVFPLSTTGMQWTSPSSPYGRSLLWLNVPIVLQATKADLLRAHLVGYRLVEKDPYSADTANKAHSAVISALGRSNSLTQPLINDCQPLNVASRIEQITKSLRETRNRYH